MEHPMTPTTPALREAVVLSDAYTTLLADKHWPRCNRDGVECPQCFGAIAAAVLTAADQGESEGPWKTVAHRTAGMRFWYASQTPEADVGPFDAQEEARAVCNALNRLAALRGTGG